MGLEDPDIDLSELIDSKDSGDSDSGKDISEMSKKEAFKKVRKEGQVNLGNNKALISCPCTQGKFLSDRVTNYMCALSMRPNPEDGKQKPVCSGPIIGRETLNGKHISWKSGTRVRSNCPYSPYRFQREDEDSI